MIKNIIRPETLPNTRIIRNFSTVEIPRIFNKRVKSIQKSNSAKNPLSKKVDYLKDEIADRVADRFLDIKRHFSKVLDLGSGAGHVVKYIDPECVGKIVQLDTSRELLFRDQGIKYPIEQERIIGDLEDLNLPENEYDAVVSSLALHWVNDLPGTLIQVRKCLKPDGVFLGCLFGGDTLFELRTSLQLAEIERDGGISPHVSPMVKHQDMGSLLSRAGFTLTTVDVDEIVVNYPSMFELMQDLQAMGENNALYARKPFVSKDVFLAASSAYKSIYGKEDGSIPATFQVIYLIGWKPHHSQPKPLERGSAQKSFKDLS